MSERRETTLNVARDADPRCSTCRGKGWHWGWDGTGDAVQLRCPCVDRNRQNRRAGRTEEPRE